MIEPSEQSKPNTLLRWVIQRSIIPQTRSVEDKQRSYGAPIVSNRVERAIVQRVQLT